MEWLYSISAMIQPATVREGEEGGGTRRLGGRECIRRGERERWEDEREGEVGNEGGEGGDYWIGERERL